MHLYIYIYREREIVAFPKEERLLHDPLGGGAVDGHWVLLFAYASNNYY